jgi:gliding motility-associated-like protein
MRTAVFLSFCVFISFYAHGQSCDCPAVSTCFTCAGGITTLTLRFNGSTAETITVADTGGTVFSQVINPNATFSFSGSLPNEKFVGTNVYLTVAGIADATIPSNCGTIFVGNVYGSFTVVAANSKNAGALCCSAANTETTPPQIVDCPADMTISLPSSGCGIAGAWTPPTATDNCTLASLTSSHEPTDLLGIGVTTVTYTAVDNYNNSSTCSFTVTVSDETAPVIENCPDDITVEAGTACGAVVSWTEPTANDNCSAAISSSHSPGTMFAFGTTAVTYTAIDPAGNVSTCVFNITVTDTTVPVITGCPSDIFVTVTACESAVSWTPPTANDNCDVSLQASHQPGDVFALGTTTVTYSATDDTGHTATCSFNVNVTADAAPVIASCPDDITLHTFDDSVEATWDVPQATPFCGELISESSHQPGAQFSAGETDVVYQFLDGTKNKSVCSFNVNVIKDEIIFEVSQAVTPNGDGINDTWLVTNIEKFNDNTVVVVDRWGNKVYHGSGYDNTNVLWNGVGPNGSRVPIGTYFYTIEVRVKESLVRNTGFVEVIY